MARQELTELMRDGSGRKVRFGQLLTRQSGLVHDVTGGVPTARYAVLDGARLGINLVVFGDVRPTYITGGPFILGNREAAESRAREIAVVPLLDAVQSQAPPGHPFSAEDYSRLTRHWFAGGNRPRPGFYSAALVAGIDPAWRQEGEFTLPLREGLTIASLQGIGALAGIELVNLPGQEGVAHV